MLFYEKKIWWKRFLFFCAVAIGVFSLWYTQRLVDKLAREEEKKVLLWANATKQLVNAEGDFNFLLDIIKDNETIPVILVDDEGNISATRNLDSIQANDSVFLHHQLEDMKAQHEPIKILYDETHQRYNYLYYKNSIILTQLKRYPYYQLSIIGIFILVAYFAFSTSRKAEQNQVWVGMSKETAHQLGTPISSLNGWIDLIRESPKESQDEYLNELQKDVKRLELITERFSKIGSTPMLRDERILEVIQNSISYLESRVGNKIVFQIHASHEDISAKMNIPLFDWVIENLSKNAIDAMEGVGTIDIQITEDAERVIVDFSDTGKGLPANKFKTIFKPGYTTKKRGWGLGLSLVKRIVEDYHKGKIFVLQSSLKKGTTFRILLQSGA
jgi:signal transduction histidine kinase